MRNLDIYQNYKDNVKVYRYPICHSSMLFKNKNSLVCRKNHCFDISKYGYVNFVPSQTKYKYTKELFESRKLIFEASFYDRLVNAIQVILGQYQNKKKQECKMACWRFS